MFVCKMCHKDHAPGRKSSNHPSLCKPCYAVTQKYRRLVKTDPASWKPDAELFMKVTKMQYRHNMAVGGYVPKWFGNEETRCHCAWCGVIFKSPITAEQCPNCTTMHSQYRSAALYHPDSKRVRQLDRHYGRMEKLGLKVPSHYLDRKSRGLTY